MATAMTTGFMGEPFRSAVEHPRSILKEHRFTLALEADVELVDLLAPALLALSDQRGAAIIGNERKDRVGRVRVLVTEIDSGREPAQQAAGENADCDMGRLHAPIRSGNRAGLHRFEEEETVGIDLAADAADEANIGPRRGLGGETPLPVRLPDLEHGIDDRLAIAVDH